MENTFIQLIRQQKIRDVEGLKRAFRGAAKKTHPDSVGSDKYIDKFAELRDQYEQAKSFLESKITARDDSPIKPVENYRYLFYRTFHELEDMELPFNKTKTDVPLIKKKRELLNEYFCQWQPAQSTMYHAGMSEYDVIKKTKPPNTIKNVYKQSLYEQIKPTVFNLWNYHITGLELYRKQLLRYLKRTKDLLKEDKYSAFLTLFLYLVEDSKKGPAVF